MLFWYIEFYKGKLHTHELSTSTGSQSGRATKGPEAKERASEKAPPVGMAKSGRARRKHSALSRRSIHTHGAREWNSAAKSVPHT